MFKFHNQASIYVSDIVLKVEDLNNSEKFYRDVLGFKVLDKNENQISLTVDGKNTIIKLISSREIIPKVPRRTGLYHIAILLPDSIQLGLFLKNIRELGYPIIGASNHGVSQAIYLEDIDRNGIEIYADIDSDLWKRQEDTIEMVTLPLDYKKLIEATGDLVWEGMPEKTIIGHIHLHVADLEEAKRFYIDGIGMDLTMEIKNSAVFTSSAGYHHHIAFNIWNGRGAKPLADNSAGMEYYTIRYPDKGVMDSSIERIKKLGYEVWEKEGQIFTKDPSENLIKISDGI